MCTGKISFVSGKSRLEPFFQTGFVSDALPLVAEQLELDLELLEVHVGELVGDVGADHLEVGADPDREVVGLAVAAGLEARQLNIVTLEC